MKKGLITLFFSVNLIASVPSAKDVFNLIERKQSPDELNEILSKHSDFCSSQNEQGQTPLIAAILTKQKELATVILRYTDEKSVNLQDNQGNTALHHTFMHNVPIESDLIKKGAKIDLYNNKKTTAMHLAANNKEQFTNILNALPTLKHWENIDLAKPDADGNTVLHITVNYGEIFNEIDVATKLVTNKAPTNIKNGAGLIPLHIAIIRGVISDGLLTDKSSYNTQDDAGYAALHLAVLFHDEKDFPLQKIIKILRKHTNEKLKDQWGYTAEELAQALDKGYLFAKKT